MSSPSRVKMPNNIISPLEDKDRGHFVVSKYWDPVTQ
jgi:hypothetical protein